MLKLTRNEAMRLLNSARDERGSDYRYSEHFPLCVNTHNGQPACIVGLALWRLAEKRGVEQFITRYSGTISNVALYARRDEVLDISRDAIILLRIAQHAQDTGETWGTAVAHAQIAYWAMIGAEGK